MNFFLPIESVSRWQSVDDCVSVVNARRIVSYWKMMSSSIASNFA
jgi:hypothetical protein